MHTSTIDRDELRTRDALDREPAGHLTAFAALPDCVLQTFIDGYAEMAATGLDGTGARLSFEDARTIREQLRLMREEWDRRQPKAG